ncbi:Transcriptional regulator, XRE family [Burkholderia multivorans]
MDGVRNVTTYGAILGAVLGQLRASAGLKQSDLADAVGIGPSTWSRIEKGESSLSTDQLKLAADALNLPPGRILDIVDMAEKATAKKGIELEPVGKASWTAGGASAAAAIGIIPVVGSLLGGIIGSVVTSQINKSSIK